MDAGANKWPLPFFGKSVKRLKSSFVVLTALLTLVLSNGQAAIGLTIDTRNYSWQDLYTSGLSEYEQGHNQSAEALLLAALGAAGASVPKHMATLEALDILYDAQGNYKAEESILLKQISVLSSASQYPVTLRSEPCEKLGNLYSYQNRFEEAQRYYKMALSLLNSSPNSSPAQIAIVLNNLGWAAYKSNSLDSAEKYFRQSLNVIARGVGEKSIFYGLTASNLAQTYYTLGHADQALTYFRKAITAFNASTGKDDPIALAVARRYASLRREAGRNGAPGSNHRRTLQKFSVD